MKFKIVLLIGILMVFIGCNKDDFQSEINGEYIGVFDRNGNTSKVELNFSNGVFSGKSETQKFPAICNGNYSLFNDYLVFENTCAWTAEFDWTLILDQRWNYTFENDSLTLTKANGDKYLLAKK